MGITLAQPSGEGEKAAEPSSLEHIQLAHATPHLITRAGQPDTATLRTVLARARMAPAHSAVIGRYRACAVRAVPCVRLAHGNGE
jgi:hypothetical protein